MLPRLTGLSLLSDLHNSFHINLEFQVLFIKLFLPMLIHMPLFLLLWTPLLLVTMLKGKQNPLMSTPTGHIIILYGINDFPCELEVYSAVGERTDRPAI